MEGERGNTTLFSLQGHEISHQERGQVNTVVVKYFNSIPFHKSGPANKQHINQIILHETGKSHQK